MFLFDCIPAFLSITSPFAFKASYLQGLVEVKMGKGVYQYTKRVLTSVLRTKGLLLLWYNSLLERAKLCYLIGQSCH